MLHFHMAELLYAYAYAKRLYNGDWGKTATEAAEVAQCVLTLSAVLVRSNARASGPPLSFKTHTR
eukprot:SAG11_NODE_21280_length_428_cov_0.939210_1_plen_64_part_10